MKPTGRGTAIVLSGGGARGAYEAGVLCHLFAEVLPRLGPGAGFALASGTSVGAIHAAYTMATAGEEPRERAHFIRRVWEEMRLDHIMRVGAGDLLALPFRALGVARLRREVGGTPVVGGLLDITPLEVMVEEVVPWRRLRRELAPGRGRTLCVSCTEVRSGRVVVFMQGDAADPRPWNFDPNAMAIEAAVAPDHVRASAAIPFLFPAVRIGDRYYVDGGLRMNTPLAPALRLGASRVAVVGLRHPRTPDESGPAYPDEVITQPGFLLGKVLDALLLDQLEYELQRMEVINALLDRGEEAFGPNFLPRINEAVRALRGTDYRRVEATVIRPSRDLGQLAAECSEAQMRRGDIHLLPRLLARLVRGRAPGGEADLLSYLYFDRAYTGELLALGREDARRHEDALAALLAPEAGRSGAP